MTHPFEPSARFQTASIQAGSSPLVFVQVRRQTENRWYISRLDVVAPTGALLRDIPLARIESAANASERIRTWAAEGVKRKAGPRDKLKRPHTRALDEQFYRAVGVAYISAVEHGLPPAKTLAEDSDTPPGTVNRWIAEARRRGYLPPAEPGKVSA